ncbi:uncharacterized protein EDB91DRAFT_1112429 [Suillus paluster]|uniref:uncharacterized protein n=1 Tax=Suillus paluster TaxID=48578 RepID=UPI001B86CC08|nr:uncharacterized protein EDB91DRAFT_1112429 [Suillus paluster]KAG1749095.1 hypothetical protein EDB91DRAFT_1112429 [Suillus paluster]
MLTVITRRAPAIPLTRLALSRGYTSSVKEGSVAQSKGILEKAHEDEYARKHEAELLRKLKAEIEAKKEELVRYQYPRPFYDPSDFEYQAKLQEKHDEVNSKQ